MTKPADATAAQLPSSRYEIQEMLGRGGMAAVYRAVDRSLSRTVALKQLTVDASSPDHASVAALFEREFHTLAQLRHPHVIAVHDYGVGPQGHPFYTMEVLDGGDLRELAPMEWRQVCRLAFDVCSALALLHSRRLLHRDISPRNIRRTQDGEAKLIDFGAMAPMSAGGTDVVGTPAFTAPETLQRMALDARTDLFSLGATLYYALTARLPYSARSFSDLTLAWRNKPVPPSAIVAGIPAELDDLVLSLVSVEPALRPNGAFDVMQQLAACAGLRVEESEAVSRAYLSTPMLVGREDELARVRELLRDSRLRRAAGVMIQGPSGSGRSRLLDACTLEAQTQGYTVLRATASGRREAFGTARALADHLLDAVSSVTFSDDVAQLFEPPTPEPANDAGPRARPVLRNFASGALEPEQLQRALRRWLQGVSRTQPLLIAVDDVHKIDQPSAALLAELIDKTKRGGILIALTADSDAAEGDALQVLERRCIELPLAPLTLEQTVALFGSLFGDVAYLERLAAEIHRVALGNPRQSLELAQHLVDRQSIRYRSGHWTLPSQLSADDLPRSAADAMRLRITRMSLPARTLAEAHSLAFYDTLTVQDYRALVPEASSSDIELALSELLAAQAIVRDGPAYVLANRVWTAAFQAELDPEHAAERHRALAMMYAAQGSFAAIHHLFAGGFYQRGLEALGQRNQARETGDTDYGKYVAQNVGKMMWVYPHAIETAIVLGRSAHELSDLRRWQYIGSLATTDPPDFESADLWFAQIAHDSGLTLYREDTESATPAERLTRALQRAYERYLATPEAERVYPPDEAIRKLGEYAVISIGINGRMQETERIRSLPEVLEPFVPLSPLLDVIWTNALGSRQAHCECRYESALETWRDTLAKLEKIPATEAHFVTPMANAIAYAIGMMEAQLGLASAATWAERLDHDQYQRVSALELRKIVRLEQGDTEGADRLRRQAEVLALQLRTPQMFKSLLTVELAAYARSRDLAGVAQVVEQLRTLAGRYPAWRFVLLYGEGTFQQVRGDYEAAMAKFAECSERTRLDEHGRSPNLSMWLAAQNGIGECLLGLGRDEEARTIAGHALSVCEARSIGALSFDLVRTIALAEGKLGDPRAAERLDALIAQQNQLGATGMRMGLSYEARARLAIWSGDEAAFERFAELTAREYRHGARTSLAARYERLLNDAARGGMRTKLSLADFEAMASVDSSSLGSDELFTVITRSMAGHHSADGRTKLALQMICAAYGATAGHLFLITPAGLVLRASQGTGAPPPELAARVTRYVDAKQQRSGEMDDMITGEMQAEDVQTSLLLTDRGSYQLLALSCVVDATSTLAGVAVVEVAESRSPNPQQAQLLNALALNVLQTGDSQGLSLSPRD